jgi:N-methylhydantoinase B
VTVLEVNAGDVIRIYTGSGGGYGDPRDRRPDLIAEDVANGLLTPDRAREVYGDAVASICTG